MLSKRGKILGSLSFQLKKKIGQPITVHPTVGIDFKVKHIVVNDKRIKLHIWDTGKSVRVRLSVRNRFLPSP